MHQLAIRFSAALPAQLVEEVEALQHCQWIERECVLRIHAVT